MDKKEYPLNSLLDIGFCINNKVGENYFMPTNKQKKNSTRFEIGYRYLKDYAGTTDVSTAEYGLYNLFSYVSLNNKKSTTSHLNRSKEISSKFINIFSVLFSSETHKVLDVDVKTRLNFKTVGGIVPVVDKTDFVVYNFESNSLELILFGIKPFPLLRSYFNFVAMSDIAEVSKIQLAYPNENTYTDNVDSLIPFFYKSFNVNDKFKKDAFSFSNMFLSNSPNYMMCNICPNNNNCNSRV